MTVTTLAMYANSTPGEREAYQRAASAALALIRGGLETGDYKIHNGVWWQKLIDGKTVEFLSSFYMTVAGMEVVLQPRHSHSSASLIVNMLDGTRIDLLSNIWYEGGVSAEEDSEEVEGATRMSVCELEIKAVLALLKSLPRSNVKAWLVRRRHALTSWFLYK